MTRKSIKAAAAALIVATGAGAVHAAESSPSLEGVWIAQGDGLLHPADGKAPPLKPAARKSYEANRAKFLAGDASLDPARRCKPPGEPRLMIDPNVPFEIVQTKPRIMIAYQWNRLVRMVEMGPVRDIIGPTYFGQNAGSWDGSTLVVDVQALHPNAFLDKSGLPHGENAHLTERFTRNGNTMEVSIHVDDPEVYTRPWDAKVTFAKQPDDVRVKEDICLEREGLLGKI